VKCKRGKKRGRWREGRPDSALSKSSAWAPFSPVATAVCAGAGAGSFFSSSIAAGDAPGTAGGLSSRGREGAGAAGGGGETEEVEGGGGAVRAGDTAGAARLASVSKASSSPLAAAEAAAAALERPTGREERTTGEGN